MCVLCGTPIFWLIYFCRCIPYLQSYIGSGSMQDKGADESRLKQLVDIERTADRSQVPAEQAEPPSPPSSPLFLDPEQPSTRAYHLAMPAITTRQCYRLHSNILLGSAISQNMRARLRSFLMSESSKQLILRETCVLACFYVDLFFSMGGRVEVSEFQSLVIGCLILASKVKEGKFPTIAFNIFSREQLLAYQKRVVRRLAYNLAPPTYHDHAHRTVFLWDTFNQKFSQFDVQFSKCARGVNYRLRRFYEQLDCVFLVLKSLEYETEAVVMNLFYVHTRMANSVMPADHASLTEDKFTSAIYSHDSLHKHFIHFLQRNQLSSLPTLDPQIGLFLRPFLVVEPVQKQWSIRGNEQALEMMRVWDRLQSSPKDNYQLAKGIIERSARRR